MFRVFLISVLAFSCNSLEEETNKVSEISVLSEAINQDPKNIDLFLKRVEYNLDRSEFESALFDLKQCIDIDSLDSHLHYKIADVYFELSKQSYSNQRYAMLVRKHLIKSIKIDNENYKSHALLGEFYLAWFAVDSSAYQKAFFHLNSSLGIEYNQEAVHKNLGYVFRKTKQYQKAVNCFRNSININPSYIEGYIEIAQTYHLQKDTLAIIYYNNALKLEPNNLIVLYNKAMFYQENRQWNLALESYSDLHKIDPFHANGHYNLGFIHMELGLHNIATNNFSDAIYTNTNYFQAYYARGSCYETLGNIAQAESDYKRSIEINPKYVYAIDALNELKLRNKEYK
jgi:tetratricopeptide (TPR) repeat protein